jgi:hypothetical protein
MSLLWHMLLRRVSRASATILTMCARSFTFYANNAWQSKPFGLAELGKNTQERDSVNSASH